jgi:regulator of protease activity HflC (stomatin/prohibitin superfamily)
MGCCAIVPHQEVGLIEKWGRFDSYAHPGCVCLNPLCGEAVMGPVSLRVQQLNVNVETKTRDNVFCRIDVSVQFQVIEDRVRDAFYKLTDPRVQCRSYVNDAIRSTVPRLNLDDVFTTKDEIARSVRQTLEDQMLQFGLRILATLVTDIEPDRRVKDSMNEINAATRLRDAATDKAEARKIGVVKQAEAEAESKYLAGVGIANQRKAIVAGLRDSIVHFSDVVQGIDPKEVMDLVLVTQYFDTLKDLGHSPGNTMFVSHTPGSVAEIASSIRAGFAGRPHDPHAIQINEEAKKIRAQKLREAAAARSALVTLPDSGAASAPLAATSPQSTLSPPIEPIL